MCKIWITLSSLCLFLPLTSLQEWNVTSCVDVPLGECHLMSVDGSAVLFCSGGYYHAFGRSNIVKALTICDYPENDFDVTEVLDYFPFLENFTLMASNVSYVRGKFHINNSLKVLNFTGLVIEKIRSHVFSALNSLRTLDLRNNRLNHLHPNVINLVNRLQKLYIKGNKWNCGKNLDWVLYLNSSIVQDMSNLTCHSQPYPNKPLKPIATLLSNLRVECPDSCDCTMPNVVTIPFDKGGGLMPVIQVDCSDRGLKKFPDILPQNTSIVILKGNQIQNVEALVTNRFYRDVVDVYLDNNLITSIDDLEGAYWLSNFRVFSLKNNKLTQVPTYVMDNALQKNHNALEIYFGLNPWRCDCLFTPSFQDLLVKYRRLIKETDDIKCSYVQGDDNSGKMIITLSRTSICRISEYLINPLDLVNGILASLIVLILGKLAYDYYTFKRTGHLPWIVTKMP